MPQVPYNTGKVKIGCHYVPKPVNLNTYESEFWQDVFIGTPRRVNNWTLFCVVLWVGFGFGYFFFQ